MTRNKPLPLNALRSFEAAARLGRFSAAAEELSVTHGAVSRQVQHLEEYLGAELFEGPRTRPRLTVTGRRLLDELTPAFDRIDRAVRAIVNEAEGVLDIACLSTFAMRWLIPRLHRFQLENPSIEIRLSTDERQADLARGRYDVVITALDAETRPVARDVTLFAEQLGVVLSPALSEGSAALRIEDLANMPRLTTVTRLNAWPIWLAACAVKQDQTVQRPTVEFAHYSFAIEAAANGLGACVVPLHLVAEDVRNGRLAAPFGFVESGYRYVARAQQPNSKRTRLFTTWLQSEAHEHDAAGQKPVR